MIKRLKSLLRVREYTNKSLLENEVFYNSWDDEHSLKVLSQLSKKAIGPLLISEAAEAAGATVTWYTRFIFKAEIENISLVFWDARCNYSSVGAKIATKKNYAITFMKDAGVPVAESVVAKTCEQAVEAYHALGSSVVVKPLSGTKGRGVSLNLTSENEVRDAYRKINSTKGVIVESMVVGEEYRFLVIGDEVVAVLAKDPPNIIGDGRSSIRELVDRKNKIRESNPRLSTCPIKLDSICLSHLLKSNLTVDSVPELGSKIYLRREGNVAVGADTKDVTDEISDAAKKIAVNAVSSLPGLDWAGVDIILTKDDKVNNHTAAYVIEVNTNPGLGGHHYPMLGKGRNVAKMVWEKAYSKQALLVSHGYR
ncbi:acetate--CoA ligase family protein [Halomonas mongoliensis]|uniref:acetate--CoA ligase family protein n=1 Tax=Halomonas mongoliensis TaxID=321265 RepID=UPI00403B25F7